MDIYNQIHNTTNNEKDKKLLEIINTTDPYLFSNEIISQFKNLDKINELSLTDFSKINKIIELPFLMEIKNNKNDQIYKQYFKDYLNILVKSNYITYTAASKMLSLLDLKIELPKNTMFSQSLKVVITMPKNDCQELLSNYDINELKKIIIDGIQNNQLISTSNIDDNIEIIPVTKTKNMLKTFIATAISLQNTIKNEVNLNGSDINPYIS